MKKNYQNHRDILREEFDKIISFDRIVEIPKTTKPEPTIFKVLEIGAGATNANEWFKEKIGWNQQLDYIGIDNGSEYMQEGVIKMDAHDMREIKDNTFDIVYLSHTAEHFVSPYVAFKEIFRVLKKGGKVLSITPYPCEHQILFGDSTHISVLSNLQWFRVLISAGFEQDNVQSYVQMTCNGKQIPIVQDYMIVTVATK